MSSDRLDVDAPRWDQTTFVGRLRHFAAVTNPLLSLRSADRVIEAQRLLQQYRAGVEPAGTTVDQLWSASTLCQSALHPDTGQLQSVIGRMSFQVPGGMTLIGCMIVFYRSTPAVVFWQWANQSFNAFVNFTNRNASSHLSNGQLATAYVSATGSALVTALGLKRCLSARPGVPGLLQRCVPLAAVIAANCVNIPLMRQAELRDGVPLQVPSKGKQGDVLSSSGKQGDIPSSSGKQGETVEPVRSRLAAAKGIAQVVLSRNVIVTPSMLLLPVLMTRLERLPWYLRRPRLHAPSQILLAGALLLFMVPAGCAIFPQICSVQAGTLQRYEPAVYSQLYRRYHTVPHSLYFNKGL